jgi:hypothetical protein
MVKNLIFTNLQINTKFYNGEFTLNISCYQGNSNANIMYEIFVALKIFDKHTNRQTNFHEYIPKN